MNSGGSGGGSGGGSSRGEAERWCQIAGRLLEARDLVGCKRFAERSLDADPLAEGVDQIVAAADVILASQRRINNHLDWYSILQLQPTENGPGPDFETIRKAYRNLALLLHPDRNAYPSAAQAFKLVSDAWTFLSDPEKKKLYDDEIKIAVQLRSNGPNKTPTQPPPPPPASFWTLCNGCFRAYEYAKEYQNKTLLCHNCRKAFQAEELPVAPPIVPGTDTYYCSWGLFPLGFPGVPAFNGVGVPEGTVHIPAFPGPGGGNNGGGGGGGGGGGVQVQGKTVDVVTTPSNRVVTRQSAAKQASPAAVRTSGRKPRKVLASKPKKQDLKQRQQQQQQQTEISFGMQNDIDVQGEKRNGVPQPSQHHHVNAGDYSGGFDMNSFSIDLDHNAVLGNLANLPFLKDDEMVIMR